jgi:hypothetical protein
MVELAITDSSSVRMTRTATGSESADTKAALRAFRASFN